MRRTDGVPLAGWTVRYDVSSGALGYEGGNTVETTTDAAGRASVEVSPKDAGGGVTNVGITVIRPVTAGPAVMPRLELGRGAASITWAPGAAAVPVCRAYLSFREVSHQVRRRRPQVCRRQHSRRLPNKPHRHPPQPGTGRQIPTLIRLRQPLPPSASRDLRQTCLRDDYRSSGSGTECVVRIHGYKSR